MYSFAQALPRYSLIIPVLNEAAVLPALLARLDSLMTALDGPAEVVFVDDGSTDDTAAVLRDRERRDPRYRLVQLSRNFGHQAAITAGMNVSRGDAVIVMDADLQDPPELVLDLVAKWREGFQVVYAQRTARNDEGAFKRWTAHLFYLGLRRLTAVDIPRDVGDFRLVDRQVVEAFRAMPERDRFVRGMFGWLGFRQTAVPFERQGRAAGQTKYSLVKMVKLAVSGVVSFSDAPLRLALWMGFAVSAAALLYGLYVIVSALMGGHGLVAGWASTMVVIAFLSGLNMMLTGVVGLYVGRIHAEVKGRPLYVVNEPGIPDSVAQIAGADLPAPGLAAGGLSEALAEERSRLARFAAG
jgi:dolichol-phosphate mannosyltransferase